MKTVRKEFTLLISQYTFQDELHLFHIFTFRYKDPLILEYVEPSFDLQKMERNSSEVSFDLLRQYPELITTHGRQLPKNIIGVR